MKNLAWFSIIAWLKFDAKWVMASLCLFSIIICFNQSAVYAGQTVDPATSSAVVRVLTDFSPDILVNSGTSLVIYGSAGSNEVRVQQGARAELLNFPGANSIQIEADSQTFKVSRSGSVVIFEADDGSSTEAATYVSVPATAVPQSIVFNNHTFSLVVENQRVMLDTLEVTLTPLSLVAGGEYSISGTITPTSGLFSDSDVNDPNSQYESNDTLYLAQSVSNPAMVGGYVNAPETGEAGRSFETGDESDYYLADMAAGDMVFLSIAGFDDNNVDLDVYIYDAQSGEMIDASLGVSDSESINITADGTYGICVYAYGGASNYVLSIGRDPAGMAGNTVSQSLHLSSDFNPGEIIVKYSSSGLMYGAARSVSDIDRTLGLQVKSGGVDREMLLDIGDEQRTIDIYNALNIKRRQFVNSNVNALSDTSSTGDAGNDAAGTQMQKKLDTLHIVKALRKRKDVEFADPNFIRKINFIPNDPRYNRQWHYPAIHLPDAWDITRGSADVVVAVVDTGVLLDHPDLETNLSHNGVIGDGYDFISDPDNARDGDGIDSNPYDVGDLGSGTGQSSFHGTHVAGTIAATTGNGIGGAGVGGDAKVMPLRVLGKYGGSDYDIIQAVRYAAGLSNDSNTLPSKKADIINLSLGGPGYSSSAQSAYTQARNAGVIIIAAAGNNGDSEPNYPASYDGVVSVSAVGLNLTLAPYSSYGQYVDVAAPGGDMSQDDDGDGFSDGILSTLGKENDNGIEHTYVFYQGTSMACPHVAGVAALMKSLDPDMTPSAFDSYIQSFEIVNDIGASGRDDLYGFGIIDALKAVQVVQGGGSIPSVLQAYPGNLDFGWAADTATITISSTGTDHVPVTGLTNTVSWLTITPEDIDSYGAGKYTVSVDRSGLSDGWYDGQINFISSVNTVTVPVSMRINTSPIQADGGHHYVLLLDPDTWDTIAQKEVDAENGSYSYAFTDLDPGATYILCAGTDFDNDYIIGDAGEAFGRYLTVDQPIEITVNGAMTDIDFDTGFNVVLTGASGFDVTLKPEFKQVVDFDIRRMGP